MSGPELPTAHGPSFPAEAMINIPALYAKLQAVSKLASYMSSPRLMFNTFTFGNATRLFIALIITELNIFPKESLTFEK